MPTFSRNLEQSLHRALALANERPHEYATLEHLLLALIDDQDAAAVMRACNVDLDKLRRSLTAYLESELENLVTDGNEESRPTAGCQRVSQRAGIHVQSSGREEVTGANVLVAIFAERESHAAYFLQEQDMTRYDAVNYISHGIAKRPGMSESRPVRGVEEETETKGSDEPKKKGDALEAYCINLNKKARDGKIDPLIGREAEISRTIQVLCRRQKNNPLFVGDAGVGKTAIAEGLARRIVHGEVPDVLEDAIAIMKGLKPYFEDYHKLKYTGEAIRAAVELSARYIHDRKLPDKAIDVIDESGAAQMLLPESRRKKTIGIKEIETTIATMARIPPKAVSKDDAAVLRHLEQTLKTVVYGQDKAIEALSASIKLARAGLREPEKPIGCYLFSGPTGVGKTEVAKQLSVSLGVHLIRFDMSEYMERHTVSRLIGAPPGYVGFDQGGLLTDGVDQHPHCVLLLDEIEKAHPDLFNVLLQIMDHGKLTDHNGKQVDFRNVILIMTTNAGASDMAKAAYGFTRQKREGDDTEAINRLFAPEFRNRLDSIITFAHLSPEVIVKVVEKFVLQLEAQLADRDVTIELSDEASDWLIEHGYDEQMGARPMSRVIQEHIKKPLADEVLFGKLKSGGHVRVILAKDDEGRDKLGFEYLDGPVTPKPEKLPEPRRSRPKRRPSVRRPKPPGPKGDGGSSPRRSSVPKVPLVKV